jgi:hypothetical protein
MKVKGIEVEIDDAGPGRYFDQPSLRVRVRTEDKSFGYTQVLIPDDLTSRFDLIWNHIGRRIKERMRDDSDASAT